MITRERLIEITTLLKDGLMEDDPYEALLYMRETVEMTPEEAELFCVDFSEIEEE